VYDEEKCRDREVLSRLYFVAKATQAASFKIGYLRTGTCGIHWKRPNHDIGSAKSLL